MNVWIVTDSYEDYDGWSDQFLGVFKSFASAKAFTEARVKKWLSERQVNSTLRVKRDPGLMRFHYEDYSWYVTRHRVKP